MPHDPERVSEVKSWFSRAASDLRAADHGLTARPPILDDVVFHCQQAVEKSLKGFLSWHDCIFRKTHSLEELGEQALVIDESLRLFVNRSVPLTEYAWRFRYPGDPDEPSPAEASDARAVAHQVFATLLERLPVEVRPSA